MREPFATIFFKLYDRKIQAGEITFSQLRMDKNHFTNMCTDKNFVPPLKAVENLCIKMKLTDEEATLLRETAIAMLEE